MIIRMTAALLLLLGAASAQIVAPQPIAFTGVVRVLSPLPSPPILCAPGTHEIECAEGIFQIQSSTIDLAGLEGKNVKLTGASAAPGCPLFEITAADLTPPATLTLCGTGGFGCPIRLASGPGGNALHYLFVSPGPRLLPVSVASGSLLLDDPLIFLAVRSSNFQPTGVNFDFVVPSNPALVGVTAYFQVVRQAFGPVGFPQPPLRWSNARCLEIVGNVFVCHPADCNAS